MDSLEEENAQDFQSVTLLMGCVCANSIFALIIIIITGSFFLHLFNKTVPPSDFSFNLTLSCFLCIHLLNAEYVLEHFCCWKAPFMKIS